MRLPAEVMAPNFQREEMVGTQAGISQIHVDFADGGLEMIKKC